MLKAVGYRPAWGVSAVMLLALALSPPAIAGTISVTTTFDQLNGAAPCSLREAVDTANADANSGGCTDANPAAADTIRLAGGDYDLSRAGVEDANASGDLDVAGSLTIAGDGADVSGIDGNGALTGDRVLQISSGTLTISGLTVHDGSSNTGGGIGGSDFGATLRLIDSTVSGNEVGGGGGGIRVGVVTLTDSTVSGNTAGTGGGGICCETVTLTRSIVSGNETVGPGHEEGGGIFGGTVKLTDSTVSGNKAVGGASFGVFGGGISASTATLTRSTVSGNTSSSDGGGIAGFTGGGTLTDSSVRRNKAGGQGGGIYGGAFLGPFTMTRSTVSENDAASDGGGVYFTGPGTMTVTNSTLSGNETPAYGGGIATDDGTTNLRSTTINRNVANGGGLARFGTATVNLRNTILTGNLDPTTDPEYNDWFCEGGSGVVSQGYNLLPPTADCFVAAATGDQAAGDPGLSQLANNGGRTLTQALLASSLAINSGHPATPGSGGAACPATDQRGVPRSLGGHCDKGAYERVSCQGKVVNRVGTSGPDSLVGTQAADGILGFAGPDVLRGGSGGDGLCAGDGNDQLFGEVGPDSLDGGGGTDVCNGGTESDQAVRCETISSIP